MKKYILLSLLLCGSIAGYAQTFRSAMDGDKVLQRPFLENTLQELTPQPWNRNRLSCDFATGAGLPREFAEMLKAMRPNRDLSPQARSLGCSFAHPYAGPQDRDPQGEAILKSIGQAISNGTNTPWGNKEQ